MITGKLRIINDKNSKLNDLMPASLEIISDSKRRKGMAQAKIS
jgi:hypothetical protein